MNDLEIIHLEIMKDSYQKRKFAYAGIVARYCRNNKLTPDKQERFFPGLDEAVDKAAMGNDMLAVGCKLLTLFDKGEHWKAFTLAADVRDWHRLFDPWRKDNSRDTKLLFALVKLFAYEEKDIAFFSNRYIIGRDIAGFFSIRIAEEFFVNEDGSIVDIEKAREEGVLCNAKIHGNIIVEDVTTEAILENVCFPGTFIHATVEAMKQKGISTIAVCDIDDFQSRESRLRLMKRSLAMRSHNN